MVFFLSRKRVVEELAKYEKETTRMSKRELERLTKFPGKSEFRERKVGKWVTASEYRKGIEHADSLHKIQHKEAERLEKRWKTWYRRRRRPLSGFDRYGRWAQRRRDLFSSLLDDKNRPGEDIDERELDPRNPLVQELQREQPRYTLPQSTAGSLPSSTQKIAHGGAGGQMLVKGAPSSMPVPSSAKPPAPLSRVSGSEKGVEGQLFESVPSNVQESELSENVPFFRKRPRRSFRDIIKSRREDREQDTGSERGIGFGRPVQEPLEERQEPPSEIPPQYRSEPEGPAAEPAGTAGGLPDGGEPPTKIPPQYRTEPEEAEAPKQKKRSFRDIISSRRQEREGGLLGKGRKRQKHGEDRTAALRAEQKTRRDADFAQNENEQNAGRKPQMPSRYSPELLARQGGIEIIRPTGGRETPHEEGSLHEWSGVSPSSEGFYGKGKAFQELLASGVTPKTEEEKEREEENIRKARKQREEDARQFVARIVWFFFIVLFVILWVLEIVMFSAWWGWLGTFIGFVLGPFLIPFFPLLALLQQESGVAVFSLILLVLAGTCLVYAWPEALRFARHWRR